MKQEIYYFEKPGPQNTKKTLEIARKRAKELDIDQVVVASTHGNTGFKALDVFQNTNVRVVVVTISHAFKKEGWVMEDEVRKKLNEKGALVVTTLHALGDDVNFAFTSGQRAAAFNAVIRETLYRFCQGMKVCVEITLMAVESGATDVNKEVIAVAGTNEGADTAVVIKPAYARDFLGLEIREILAKPRQTSD